VSTLSHQSLKELAPRYFRQKGYNLQSDVLLEGSSGMVQRFDLVISKNDLRHPIWIMDWKRTIGVNMVIKMDKAAYDVGFAGPILVADKFSDHAKAYANRRGVTLVSKRDISP